MRVIVIGAGLGGLCLAHGLRRAGIDVAVYERDAALDARRQGYRIHLDGRGATALHGCLPADLYELFTATCGRPSRRITVVDRDLKQLRQLRAPEPDFADPARISTSVDRFVLRTILSAGLDGLVHFGRECVGCEVLPDGTVRADFADGTGQSGDVLVAADGAGSRIRARYLPQGGPRDLGDRVVYGKTSLAAAVAAAARVPELVRDGFAAVVGGRRMSLALGAAPDLGLALGMVDFREDPDQAAQRLWPGARFGAVRPYVMWALSGKAGAFPHGDADLHALDAAALHAMAATLLADWSPDLRALIAAADPAETFLVDVRCASEIGPWPATPVTLLGDAIHAMPPSRGSGANIALKDAWRLSVRLGDAAAGDASLLEAIGAYEADMRDYGFAAMRDSLALLESGGGPVKALTARFARRGGGRG